MLQNHHKEQKTRRISSKIEIGPEEEEERGLNQSNYFNLTASEYPGYSWNCIKAMLKSERHRSMQQHSINQYRSAHGLRRLAAAGQWSWKKVSEEVEEVATSLWLHLLGQANHRREDRDHDHGNDRCL